MPILVTLELPDRVAEDLAGCSANDLRWILADALYEYVSHRANGDAVAYVNKRYPVDEPSCAYPAGPNRDRKIAKVTRFCRWANALHGFINVHIENTARDIRSDL